MTGSADERRGGMASPASHPLLAALRTAIGQEFVLAGGDLPAFELDWRQRCRGKALAVARPADTAQVAEIMRICARHGVGVVPQGGNTGLVGGSVPDDSGSEILLSTLRMSKIRQVDTANLTLTAEAGCVLQSVQDAAMRHGLLFPLSLGAEGSCTIGGNLATNAGGTQVLRYGNARELCLGLEVVTAGGEIWSGLTGLRKDNTGYDLRDLFIGSEGTLGIITAATLKLFPQPAAVTTAMAGCGSLDAAVRLLELARIRTGPALTGFEAMNAASLALVAKHFPQLRQPLPAMPWIVLVELSDVEGEAHARDALEALLGEAIEGGLAADAAVAENLAQAHHMWHLRESITLAQAQEGFHIKHDVALPASRLTAFCADADALLARAFPQARVVNFGHLGDGNLHYNVQAPAGGDSAEWVRRHEEDVTGAVYDTVAAHGGSISAEHGIGAIKRARLARHKHPLEIALMRSLKQALDPGNLLNPGRLLPPPI
ncbi:FAD-binding oxidoreductase [Pigmentiphaga soli]|uniref:FAD-binding oxidoreductase n=1 Tax=Pigmentiphaga soli TaxID=1007095 RepID=A0ABP8GIV2_9BURK